MKVDLVFINQTDSLIKFEILEKINSTSVTTTELNPLSTSKIFSYDYDGVEENITPETCCNDFLSNVYATRDSNGLSKIIELNDALCVTHLNNKSVDILNYESEIVTNRHFRYTYTFKKSDFENAVPCE